MLKILKKLLIKLYICAPLVDVSKVKVIRVNEGDSVWIDKPEETGKQSTIRWVKGLPGESWENKEQKQGPIKFDNIGIEQAGGYVILWFDRVRLVNVTYTISIWVEVASTPNITIKVVNQEFTEDLKNRSSNKYKKFENFFKTEMNKAFQNYPGYIGVEIIKIAKGSVQVLFRVKIKTTIKDSSETTSGVRVNVTQTIIDNAKDGHIEQLQIDPSPEALKISAPPPSPKNIRLLEVFKDGAEIAWDRPKNYAYFSIKAYMIEYRKFGSSIKKTSNAFKDVSIRLSGLHSGTSYVARVIALNDYGRGLESDAIDIKTEEQFPSWAIVVIVIVPIVILLVVILVLVCYRHRVKRIPEAAARDEMTMKQLDKMKERYPRSYYNEGVASLTISEKCIIYPRDRLVLLFELGSGEFGVAYRGQLLDNDYELIECAVKTCKEKASDEEMRGLYQELDIMVNIGHHRNLVNVIGACEERGRKRDKLYMLLEFAHNGSLIDYLREQRHNPCDHPKFKLHYTNRLKLALDVSRGMAFLASKRCVHRDLAARNVLLDDMFVAKVADFGLSRDVYETGEYEKNTSGKLPVKWMALESLEQRKFTLQTDVWSFGVLLWEIETKGLMPHGGMAFKDLLEKQKNGYRLEKPPGTPDKLYRLMSICWSTDPKKRPSFSQLCDLLEVLMVEEMK